MSDQKFYKVVCEEIDLILLIKKLTMEDEKKQYFAIKRKISSLKRPLTIESYQTFILNQFLHKPDDFFSNLPEDDEDSGVVIKAVYNSIVTAYPPFDLNFVCSDINNGTFLEDVQDHLGEIFAQVAVGTTKVAPNPAPQAIHSLKDIDSLDKYLKSNLVGQDEAVGDVLKSIKLIASGLYKNASFFFIGPTGVGKTELGKLLGKKYSGHFWKINCAEYAASHEYAKLIGSPPGYVGHTDSSLMAEKAEKSNRWVILLDEIEKAHPKFYDFLLSLLDDGSCTDNMGRVLDFSESIFIFTSNQGVSDIRGGQRLGFGKDVVSVSSCEKEIRESVKKQFPPEFLNRIDNYIFFNTLTQENVRKIARLSLKGIPIKRLKVLLDYIVKEGYSEEYGARNIKRFIKNEVAPVVAEALLEQKLPKKQGDLYTPKIVDGKLTIVNIETEPRNQAAG